VETGKELSEFTDPTMFGVGARVILLQDSRFALGLFGDNTARLWRLPDLPPVKEKP
jgi:hypothetical protein